MKRIAIISLVTFSLILCSVRASLYAIKIEDITMIDDYDTLTCSAMLPDPKETFDARYDKEMCVYLYLEDVHVGDTDSFKWYYESQFYTEQEPYLFLEAGNFCHGSCLNIINTPIEHMTGWWTVEVYLNGVLRVGEQVYLEGITTTTTSYSSHPTTSIYPTNPCMMSSIYGDDSEQTAILRGFRDKVLSQTPEGRALIKLYYLWSPTIVRAMEQDEEFKEEVKQMIESVLPIIEDEME